MQVMQIFMHIAASRSGSMAAESAPPVQGSEKRQVICRIEATTGRQALGEAGDNDGWKFLTDRLYQIVRGGFALHVGARGQDDFRDLAPAEALEQRGDPQVPRADVIQRAEPSVERVVLSLEGTGAFQGKDVRGLLDHTKC